MMSPVATVSTPATECATRLFRTLGDENRLRLLEEMRPGEQCVRDLSDAIGGSQPLLSSHLKTFEDAGLVTDRREHGWVRYVVNADALDEPQRLLWADQASVDGRAECRTPLRLNFFRWSHKRSLMSGSRAGGADE